MKKIVIGVFVAAATMMVYVGPVLAGCGGW
jgi:hypothetical protein